MRPIERAFESTARLDRVGVVTTRIGLVVVLVWIGGLKAYHYEAEGIVPYVANSPLMNFFYRQPAGEYREHRDREGEFKPGNRAWHERNGTYSFAHALGSVIVTFGILIALNPWLPRVSAVGSLLVAAMSVVTLSFLVTTPECWVQPLGGPEHGFPMLAGPGRLVIKDVIMMGCGDRHRGRLREDVFAEKGERNARGDPSRDLRRGAGPGRFPCPFDRGLAFAVITPLRKIPPCPKIWDGRRPAGTGD